MSSKPAGTIIVELSLEATKYTSAQKEVLAAAEKNSADIEQTFGSVGITSDKMYDAMRKRVQNSLAAIKQSHLTSTGEIVRAEQAAAEKIKQINEQQYGAHVSMIDMVKKNWFAVTAMATAAFYTVSRMAEAYMAAEQASLKMGMAMKNQGDYTRAALEDMEDYASALQRTTGYGDDATLALMANLKSYGMTNEEVKRATKTALDFAAAKQTEGLSVTTAGELIGKAYAGNTATLSRYGIVIDQSGTGAGKFTAVMDQLNQRFGDSAQARLTTYAGQWEYLKETWGDIQEFLGLVFLKTIQVLSGAIASMGAIFLGAVEGMLKSLGWLSDKLAAFASTLGMDGTAGALSMVSGKLQDGAKWAKEAGDAATKYAADQMKMVTSSNHVADALDRMGKAGSRTGKAGGPGGTADNAAMKEEENKFTKMSQIRARTAAAYQKMYQDILAGQLKYLNDSEAIDLADADAFRKSQEAKIGALSKFYEDSANIKKTEEDARLNSIKDAADFYDSILGYEQEAHDRKVALIEAERDARIAAGIDAVAAEKKAQQEIGRLNQQMFEAKAQQVHSALGDMASAFQSIGSMYDENSKEYARMQEAAKAMIVLQQAVAVVNAAAAISAAAAAPFPAGFVAMAAMAAAMGSLLASIGASIGGGASSAPALPASSVLGADAGTGSESIANAWEKMMDLDTLQYGELRGIHDSMKDLNQNITGLVTSIIRTGDVGGFGVSLSGSRAQSDIFSEKSGNALWALTGLDASRKLTEKLNIPGGSIDLPGKINEILSGWAGKLFGGGVKKSLTETGIEFEGMTAGQLIAGEYVDALQYGVVKTVKDGGLFGKDKTSYQTIYDELDSGVNRMFGLVMMNMSESLVSLAEGLGTDVDAALAYVFAGEQLDLKGLTGEEMTKKINEYFSGMADTAAEALFGDLIAQYQQLDEGLFETAARLVIDKEIILETLSMTGQAFAGTIPEIIAFSEAIIDMAGGLDNLTEAASTYYDKFFTDAEKQARLMGQLTGALGVLPGDRNAYRDLVESLNLANVADQERYVLLMQLSEAADRYYSTLEDLQEEYLKNQVDMWDDLLAEQERYLNALKSRVETVTQWLSGMNRSTTSPVGSRSAWETEYARQRAIATAPGATDQAVSTFLSYAKEYLNFQKMFTGGDYRDVYAQVMADVQGIGDLAAAQIPAAERQFDAIRAADEAAREAAGMQLEATRDTNALLASIGGTPIPRFASGGLMTGPSLGGEKGLEWAVPTYEPERSRFLRDVGADPEAIGRAVARHVGSGGGGNDMRPIHVHLHIGDKEVATSVVRSLKGGDPELVRYVKKAVA